MVILGSSNAIPDEEHENTYMALVANDRTVLIDCGNNAVLRMEQAGLDCNQLTDIILTHFHPDHVSGMPSLLMNMWLLGRKLPLNIHGLDHTLDRMEQLMDFYGWSDWPNFYSVTFNRVPEKEMNQIMEGKGFRILYSPLHHHVPTIGLRIEFTQDGKVLAYSSDTEPCEEMVELARQADVLIHEASGAAPGHSSATQAGRVARDADAKALYLIHYPTGKFASDNLVSEAKKEYDRPVFVAHDFMELDF